MLLLAGCGGYEQRAQDHFAAGEQMMEQEKYDEALREFKLVALSFRHSSYAELAEEKMHVCAAGGIAVRARDYIFVGNTAEAERLARVAWQTDETLPVVIFVNGLVAYLNGDEGYALQMFVLLRELEGAEDYVQLAVGMGILTSGNPERAQEHFRMAFEEAEVRATKELALLGVAMSRLAVPVEKARNLVLAFPTYHEELFLIYYVTGRLYSEGEGLNYHLAEYNLRQAAELSEDDELRADAQAELATILLRKPGSLQERSKNVVEGQKLVELALEYDPKNVEYRYILEETRRLRRLYDSEGGS